MPNTIIEDHITQEIVFDMDGTWYAISAWMVQELESACVLDHDYLPSMRECLAQAWYFHQAGVEMTITHLQ